MKSLITSATDYVAFDLETTGLKPSHDEILEIGAVRVENGSIVETFHTFVQPASIKEWPDAQKINSISPDMVAGAPSPRDACTMFETFVGDLPIVGHNAAGFDSLFIRKAVGHDIGRILIDTLRISKRFSPTPLKRLGVVYDYIVEHGAEPVDKSLGSAHSALFDAAMTAAVYEFFKADIIQVEETNGFWRTSDLSGKLESPVTKARQEILARIRFLLERDKALDQMDIYDMLDAIEDVGASRDVLLKDLSKVLRKSLSSSELLPLEQEDVLSELKRLSDPVARNPAFIDILFNDKRFVVTGDFEYGGRMKDIAPLIQKHGGSVSESNPTKRTDYVVVGNKGSKAWSFGNYGSKVATAIELQAKGSGIEIISEDVLLHHLGIGHSFSSCELSAGKASNDDEKEFRKRFMLPVTKGIVYYERGDAAPHFVTKADVISVGQITGLSSILITLDDGRQIRICSEYLSDMQSPGFTF